ELGARLRRAGWTLVAEPERAGTHHCPPRPSLAELGRRWRNGMFAGPGLALRHAWGGSTFSELMSRQWLYRATLASARAGTAAAALTAFGGSAALWFWIWGAAAAWGALAWRKRSLRLAALSLLTWGIQGVALVRVWLFGPWGSMARGSR